MKQRFGLYAIGKAGKLKLLLLILLLSTTGAYCWAQSAMEVGAARIDITPETPIRLAGFGLRTKAESEGTLLPLNAKALAIGSGSKQAVVIITVDLIGIPGYITEEVAARIQRRTGLDRTNLVICASHTHSGPEVGTLLNILQYRTSSAFSDSLLAPAQLLNITKYLKQLPDKLEKVALDAMNARKPASLSWGQGQVAFAKNRRLADGPVDHAMPLLVATDHDGKVRAILVNYACHAVTLGYEGNKIHSDWVGEAQRQIEQKYPGAIALVSVGCGADANPSRDGMENKTTLEQTVLFGKLIADEASRMIGAGLQPITARPAARFKQIELPFNHLPDRDELMAQTADKTVKGYYARLALERIARGETLPAFVNYPVQTFVFGKQLTMVFLGGEVVADYALRIKKELNDKVWVTAYANDVPCYIASSQALKNPRYRYETESSMYYYNKPAPFAGDVEERIIGAVRQLLKLSK